MASESLRIALGSGDGLVLLFWKTSPILIDQAVSLDLPDENPARTEETCGPALPEESIAPSNT